MASADPPPPPAPTDPGAVEVDDVAEKGTVRPQASNPGDFTVGQALGGGPFSRVEVWKDKATGETVVARTVTGTIDADKFLQGAKALLALEHPSILRTLGYVPQTETTQAALLTTHAGPLTLEKLLASGQKITATQKAIIIVGIAQAVKYLHGLSVVLGNLKPSNVAIDRSGHPQVILSAGVFAPQSGLSDVSPLYASPELLNTGEVTAASDVYALALITYEVITGKPVYDPALGQWPLLQKIMGDVRPDLPPGLPDTLASLLQSAWGVDAAARPTADAFFEALSTTNFAIAEGVDVGVVRRYVAKFVSGAQPGESTAEADARENAQVKSDVAWLKEKVAELSVRLRRANARNLQLEQDLLVVTETVPVLLDKVAALEAQVQELAAGKGDGE